MTKIQDKRKKKRRMLAAALGVSALIIAGLTFAWYTSTDSVTNTFKTGNFKTAIVESFTAPTQWQPGVTTDKVVQVTNTGSIDAFTRVELEPKLTYDEKALTPLVKDTDYTAEGDDTSGYTYYRKTNDDSKILLVEGVDYVKVKDTTDTNYPGKKIFYKYATVTLEEGNQPAQTESNSEGTTYAVYYAGVDADAIDSAAANYITADGSNTSTGNDSGTYSMINRCAERTYSSEVSSEVTSEEVSVYFNDPNVAIPNNLTLYVKRSTANSEVIEYTTGSDGTPVPDHTKNFQVIEGGQVFNFLAYYTYVDETTKEQENYEVKISFDNTQLDSLKTQGYDLSNVDVNSNEIYYIVDETSGGTPRIVSKPVFEVYKVDRKTAAVRAINSTDSSGGSGGTTISSDDKAADDVYYLDHFVTLNFYENEPMYYNGSDIVSAKYPTATDKVGNWLRDVVVTEDTSGNKTTKVYYYYRKLLKSGATTEPLLESVTFKDTYGESDADKNISNIKFDIVVNNVSTQPIYEAARATFGPAYKGAVTTDTNISGITGVSSGGKYVFTCTTSGDTDTYSSDWYVKLTAPDTYGSGSGDEKYVMFNSYKTGENKYDYDILGFAYKGSSENTTEIIYGGLETTTQQQNN